MRKLVTNGNLKWTVTAIIIPLLTFVWFIGSEAIGTVRTVDSLGIKIEAIIDSCATNKKEQKIQNDKVNDFMDTVIVMNNEIKHIKNNMEKIEQQRKDDTKAILEAINKNNGG